MLGIAGNIKDSTPVTYGLGIFLFKQRCATWQKCLYTHPEDYEKYGYELQNILALLAFSVKILHKLCTVLR